MPNIYFNKKPHLSAREVRWMETLTQFPGQWKYKPGKVNPADPLSRMPSFYLMTITKEVTPTMPRVSLLDRIKKGYEEDTSFPTYTYTQHKGIYYNTANKIVIPNNSDLKQYIISECHDSRHAGHMGRDKTLHAVSKLFHWKGMTHDIKQYIDSCHVSTKSTPTATQGLLHPIEVGTIPWHHISVDLITALPNTTKGHNAILTVVDRCTKMVHLIPTHETLTAQGFAQLMQDHIFCKHGLATDIIHDRDPRFTGNFFKQVCKALGLHQSMTSAWHPQSDGQTERMNRTIEQVLRAHTATSEAEWDSLLSMVEFAMNNSLHSGIKNTPFFLNTGLHPLTPIMLETLQVNAITCQAALDYTTSRQQAFKHAMEQLERARDRYKSYADASRKDTTFQVGDKVLLSTVNLSRNHENRKLYPRFIGPFPHHSSCQ